MEISPEILKEIFTRTFIKSVTYLVALFFRIFMKWTQLGAFLGRRLFSIL